MEIVRELAPFAVILLFLLREVQLGEPVDVAVGALTVGVVAICSICGRQGLAPAAQAHCSYAAHKWQ